MSFANYNPSAFIRAHKMPVQKSEVLWKKIRSKKKNKEKWVNRAHLGEKMLELLTPK